MLKELRLKAVGPSPSLEASFAERLNVITGDNGLGKSFLLDIAWWALTRRWPGEVNRTMVSSGLIRPVDAKKALIEFEVTGSARKNVQYSSSFSPMDEAWTGKAGRPINPGMVLYAMADGSFALWDPARNYWKKKGNIDVQDRVPAYVFSQDQVWNGLVDPDRGLLCNGLLADWALWQKEGGEDFKYLKSVLTRLSPHAGEPLEPGPLRKVALDDPREYPTLKMPYGQNVPVHQASSGMKRVIALAYLLVWSWRQHWLASEILQQAATKQMVFLIDEVEAHLHPRWQRTIVGALLDVVSELANDASVQIIMATHSPLVMASIEPRFSAKRDAWFDLDLEAQADGTSIVEFREREFVRQGGASDWLTSDAFDLAVAGSLEAEDAIGKAETLLSGEVDPEQALAVDSELRKALGDTHPFWIRWRFVGEKQGWLK